YLTGPVKSSGSTSRTDITSSVAKQGMLQRQLCTAMSFPLRFIAATSSALNSILRKATPSEWLSTGASSPCPTLDPKSDSVPVTFGRKTGKNRPIPRPEVRWRPDQRRQELQG